MHRLVIVLLALAGFILTIPFVVYFTDFGILFVPENIYLGIINKENETLNGLYIAFLSLILFALLISIKDKNINKKYQSWLGLKIAAQDFNQIKISTYVYTLIFLQCIIFVFFFDHTAFEWSTTGEINSILRLQNENYLIDDFYTNSLEDSPKFIFAFFIHLFSFLGLGWYEVLYFIKWVSAISVPPLLFVFYLKVLSYWNISMSSIEIKRIYPIIFIGSLGPFCILQILPRMDPFGWGAIQYFTSTDPMRMAFVLGLLFLIFNFFKKSYLPLRVALLFLSTLFHPAVGLCHYIVAAIFVLTKKTSTINLSEFLILLLVSVIFPSYILFLFFDSSNYLSAQEFFDIYIIARHPHHYLISDIFDIHSVIWILLMMMPILISVSLKHRKLFLLTSISFCLMALAVLVQYFFSEIIPNKLIMKAGPSRFTSFLSLVLTLNIAIVFLFSKNTIFRNKIKNYYIYDIFKLSSLTINQMLFYVEINYLKKKTYLMFGILLVVSSFFFTLEEPRETQKDGSTFETLMWLKNNTSEDSVIFSPVGSLDPALLRVYAEKSVYADWMFPFNEKYMKEFNNKYQFYKQSEFFSLDDYSCMNIEKIDYLVLNNSNVNKQHQAVFKTELWSVYDNAKLSCF